MSKRAQGGRACGLGDRSCFAASFVLRNLGFGVVFASLLACAPLVAEPVKLAVDHSRSFVAVRIYKGGLFGFLAGHEHGIMATEWSADICYDQEDPGASGVSLSISVNSLRIDTEEARRQAGLNPKSGPKPDDVRKIQKTMLTPENLAAEKYPEIRFRTTSVEQKGSDTLLLRGPLTIRSRTRTVSVPARVDRLEGGVTRFSGKVSLKQRDYGIEPASFGGLVKVKNKVDLQFDIYTNNSGASCGRSALPPDE